MGPLKESESLVASQSLFAAFFNRSVFDVFAGFIICLSVIAIGGQTSYEAAHFVKSDFWEYLENVCAAFFLVEYTVCGIDLACGTRSSHDLLWFHFDTVLTFASCLEYILMMIALSDGNGRRRTIFIVKCLKILRMVRILRLVRTIRFFTKLRIMVLMIVSSCMSLFWLFVLLAVLLYVFAIFLCQGATEYRQSSNGAGPAGVAEKIPLYWGGIQQSMFTLMLSITGGAAWGDLFASAAEVGTHHAFVFVVFQFGMVFSVLNIVTAVTVDGAIQIGAQDRAVQQEKAEVAKKKILADLYDMVEQMDKENAGYVNLAQFETCVSDRAFAAKLEAIAVDASDPELLFTLLDTNCNGTLCIGELIEGLQRIQGIATRFDVHEAIKLATIITWQNEQMSEQIRICRMSLQSAEAC